jgi:hypothetical protein
MSIYDKEEEESFTEVYSCRGSRFGCELSEKSHWCGSLKEIHFVKGTYRNSTGEAVSRHIVGICGLKANPDIDRSLITIGKKWLSSFTARWQ